MGYMSKGTQLDGSHIKRFLDEISLYPNDVIFTYQESKDELHSPDKAFWAEQRSHGHMGGTLLPWVVGIV
jgi:hypothetical protein